MGRELPSACQFSKWYLTFLWILSWEWKWQCQKKKKMVATIYLLQGCQTYDLRSCLLQPAVLPEGGGVPRGGMAGYRIWGHWALVDMAIGGRRVSESCSNIVQLTLSLLGSPSLALLLLFPLQLLLSQMLCLLQPPLVPPSQSHAPCWV